MKKLLILLLTVVALNAHAQKAKIYFISANEIQAGMKSFTNLTNRYLYVDKQKACGLKRNGAYALFEVEPGEHNFNTQTGKSDLSGSVTLNIEAGKKYYLAYFPNQPIWELTAASGERLIVRQGITEGDCKETEKD